MFFVLSAQTGAVQHMYGGFLFLYLHITKHQLYFIVWFHKFILYDPRNPKNSECADEGTLNPDYNSKGIAHFDGFYPNGDYYLYIEKYGYFGYLSHPWREEVWIYGEELVKGFEKIENKIGFIKKAALI